MGANCSELCQDRPPTAHPSKEVEIFKTFYTDVLLPHVEKQGKTPCVETAFNELGGAINRGEGVEGHGKLTREKLARSLNRLRYPGCPDDIFDIVDVDNEGIITLDEFTQLVEINILKNGHVRVFKSWLSKKYKSPEKAFAKLDFNEDTVLKPVEFAQVMERLKFNGDADVLFRILDADEDQVVTLHEFKALLGKTSRSLKDEAMAPAAA
eukprot:TRINITY_DN65616_c0_g1_i1.p1 TRINITY_DN65616_c0_g1~~TRINITY_DN65616_c0_g1_i1.p1  ORF type:complete len:224 (+),score=39.43 TRINITY_DN65616_c0_g1_i1:45-674(+)